MFLMGAVLAEALTGSFEKSNIVAARFNIWMQIRSTEDTGSESSIAGVR
jgi:hypothetical protein